MKPTQPFYPHKNDDITYGTGGITVRDYIAIEAMKAIISANPKKDRKTTVPEEKQVAIVAYIFADALIAQSNNN